MKTGLVLEGGALRTIYSSGVTDGLLGLGLDFDYVVGVSAGIAYGVSFISRQFGRNLEILTRYADDPRYMGWRNMLRPGNRRCYFGLRFIYDDIPNELVPFDYDAYDAWPGVAEAVVTNLRTGRPAYLPVDLRGKDMRLLEATCAMPLLFPVYDLDGLLCLDGGASDAIPWRRALEQGCDRVVVVLTRERAYRRSPEKLEPLIDAAYRRYPNFVRAMRDRAGRYNASREALFDLERSGRAFVFAPDSTEGFSRVERDVDKIRALWRQGYEHARARAEELGRFLR